MWQYSGVNKKKVDCRFLTKLVWESTGNIKGEMRSEDSQSHKMAILIYSHTNLHEIMTWMIGLPRLVMQLQNVLAFTVWGQSWNTSSLKREQNMGFSMCMVRKPPPAWYNHHGFPEEWKKEYTNSYQRWPAIRSHVGLYALEFHSLA